MIDVAELGRRIRKIRLERRQTLKQVEDASGLSSTHLSEIERGRTSPTVGALVRIARALDRDASYFIELEERSDVAYTPREQRRPAAGAIAGESLSPGIPGSCVYPYRLTLAQGQRTSLTIKGQELPGSAIYVVRRGQLEVDVNGKGTLLSPGDSLHVSLSHTHRLRLEGSQAAEVLCVTTRPLE